MCLPTESSPTRFNTEVATRQQAQADKRAAERKNYQPNPNNNSRFSLKPGDKMFGGGYWALPEDHPDNPDRPEPEKQTDPAFALTGDAITNQSNRKQKLKITNRTAVRTGNRKSKLSKSGGSGVLRTSMNTINT